MGQVGTLGRFFRYWKTSLPPGVLVPYDRPEAEGSEARHQPGEDSHVQEAE